MVLRTDAGLRPMLCCLVRERDPTGPAVSMKCFTTRLRMLRCRSVRGGRSSRCGESVCGVGLLDVLTLGQAVSPGPAIMQFRAAGASGRWCAGKSRRHQTENGTWGVPGSFLVPPGVLPGRSAGPAEPAPGFPPPTRANETTGTDEETPPGRPLLEGDAGGVGAGRGRGQPGAGRNRRPARSAREPGVHPRPSHRTGVQSAGRGRGAFVSVSVRRSEERWSVDA